MRSIFKIFTVKGSYSMQKHIQTILFLVLAASISVAQAAPLDKVQFLKISPQDAKAVVKLPDGKLQVVKPGDAVVADVTVKEIAQGRIVLDDKSGKDVETVIVRMESGKQRVERLKTKPDDSPMLVAPGKGGK